MQQYESVWYRPSKWRRPTSPPDSNAWNQPSAETSTPSGSSSAPTYQAPTYQVPTYQPPTYQVPTYTPPTTSGIYPSLPNNPWVGGIDFTSLNAGGSVNIGDMNYTQGNQTGMYQAYTNLIGTGLQTDAQRDVALTQILPALQQQQFGQSTVFPYLQTLISQNGAGGGGLSGALTTAAISNLNPAHEQAALNAADANAARAAQAALQQGLRNVAGSGWSPASPVGAALTAALQAGQVGAAETAKRNIRNDFAQQRISSLAQALNSQTNHMAPIYSLLTGLLR